MDRPSDRRAGSRRLIDAIVALLGMWRTRTSMARPSSVPSGPPIVPRGESPRGCRLAPGLFLTVLVGVLNRLRLAHGWARTAKGAFWPMKVSRQCALGWHRRSPPTRCSCEPHSAALAFGLPAAGGVEDRGHLGSRRHEVGRGAHAAYGLANFLEYLGNVIGCNGVDIVK